MYKALYRAYRPEIFEEVLGQEHIIRILQNQVAADEVSHAYLFCGTRGTGKTTIARLLAKAVNCTAPDRRPCGQCPQCRGIQEGTFMDLIEIDAASNNGVDNIRELRESVQYPPVVGRKKVYIMDEVHMLSTGAYNALLKTLEEPPENVMFILCTTEPEKLPATILSRCVRMDFRRVSEKELLQRMDRICQERQIQVEPSGAALIAAAADGSVRDGLSILEQCISGRQGMVTREDVLEALGGVGEEAYLALTEAVVKHRTGEGLLQIESMLEAGKDARQILQGWLAHFRNLLLAKFLEDPQTMLRQSVENVERLQRQSLLLSTGVITESIRELSKTIYDANKSTQPRVLLEMVFVKLAAGDGMEEAGTSAPLRVENSGRGAREERNPFGSSENPTQETFSERKEPVPPMEEAIPWEPPMRRFPGHASTSQDSAVVESYQSQEKPLREGLSQAKNQDLGALWNRFLDAGERSISGQFFFLRGRTEPLELTEQVLIIRAQDTAQQVILDNGPQMDQLLSQVAGYPLRLQIGQDKPQKQPQGESTEEIRHRAAAVLGFDVKIQS